MRKFFEFIGVLILGLLAMSVVAILGFILYQIAYRGLPHLNLNFLTQFPKNNMTTGGIFPVIVGSFYVTMLTMLIATPLGVGCGIFLHEYLKNTFLGNILRMIVLNLSGVPSIVFGLLGFVLFVEILGFGASIFSASATLSILILPWIVTATEEALKTVPVEYRKAALALGAKEWQVLWKVVLPVALPGIITGVVLGVARSAGETAPLLFTGVAYFLPFLPDSIFSEFMALPYHIYVLTTQHHSIETVVPIAYATALVLLILVTLCNIVAIVVRYMFRSTRS